LALAELQKKDANATSLVVSSMAALAQYLARVEHTDREPVTIGPLAWQKRIMHVLRASHNGRVNKGIILNMRATFKSLEEVPNTFVVRQLEDSLGRLWYVRPTRLFDRRDYPASEVHFHIWMPKDDAWLEV
jgi:hypothetical protein